MENKTDLNKLAQAIAARSAASEEKTEEKKEKTTPIKIVVNRTPLDIFRYSLTGMLVAVKLGLFSYLMVNPLATVSWWLVFLPAYIIEAALLAFVVGLGVVAVVITLGALIWFGFRLAVVDPIRRRRFTKKLDAAEKSGKSTGNSELDLAVALRKAIGGLEPKSPLDGLDEIK